MARSLPKKAWEESQKQFGTRLRAAVQKANNKYAVGNLCKQFPQRISDLLAKGGDKLKNSTSAF